MAVGDGTGSSLLHIITPGAGTNSLHAPGWPPRGYTEEVAVRTFGSHAERAGLDHITLVKINTEGHDLAVLRGARELLAGKLTSAGVEIYPSWDAEPETFVEGNYVACRESVAERLPAVKWWKFVYP